jgi:hypothetical protein
MAQRAPYYERSPCCQGVLPVRLDTFPIVLLAIDSFGSAHFGSDFLLRDFVSAPGAFSEQAHVWVMKLIPSSETGL